MTSNQEYYIYSFVESQDPFIQVDVTCIHTALWCKVLGSPSKYLQVNTSWFFFTIHISVLNYLVVNLTCLN